MSYPTQIKHLLQAYQKKDGYRFVVYNSSEVTPFDWYNARFDVNFKVNKLADGANLAAEDHNGIVNGSHSFIQKVDVKMNGLEVYDCNNANHVVNINKMLLFSICFIDSNQ